MRRAVSSPRPADAAAAQVIPRLDDATGSGERVTIKLRRGKSGGWRTVGYIVANGAGIFQAKMRLKATKKDWLRAVATGSGTSLAFSLTRPRDPHIGPFT